MVFYVGIPFIEPELTIIYYFYWMMTLLYLLQFYNWSVSLSVQSGFRTCSVGLCAPLLYLASYDFLLLILLYSLKFWTDV